MAEIRNPNLPASGGDPSPGGDSRGLVIFTLIALVLLLGYNFFFKSKMNPQQPQQQQTQSQQAAMPAAPTSPAAAGSIATAVPAIAAASMQETTVENDQFRIVFTNQGARVRHWILKHYQDSAGRPLDMVQAQAAERFGLPLTLFTYEPALNNQLTQALYQVTATGAQPVNGQAHVPATSALTFHYSDGALDVVKTVRFDQSYVVTVETQVRRNGQPVRALVSWPAGLGDMEEFANGQGRGMMMRTPSMFAWSIAGKADTLAAPKVAGNATLDQPYEYAAITDLYFTAAFLPDAPQQSSVVTLHNTIDLPSDPSDPNSKKRPADLLGLAVGDQSGSTRVRIYAGPKQMDVLKTIHAIGADGRQTGSTLEPLIQFGWLTVIAKPLYLALRWFRGLLGPGAFNWGWAIIIVTVIFNVAMLPTRLIMMRSSLKMMRIQPKVDQIKRKYQNLKATDPKRAEMNQEMMALYKTEGVNMYGSCLPMLVQMPLFFAYYRVLYNAVELRQAEWFWLHDLSVADPHYILPGIIIVSMFLAQWITPSPGMDPAQRRMMAFMLPIIMGFTLSNFASGLALYWCTSNLINLGIQTAINYSPIGREMHEIAARRAAKKAGSKTIQGKR